VDGDDIAVQDNDYMNRVINKDSSIAVMNPRVRYDSDEEA